jgi:hypothetical protein
MATKSLLPPVKPLPGKKTDYSHVPSLVDCRRVVTKRANIFASPTVTRPTTVTIGSQIPVRVPCYIGATEEADHHAYQLFNFIPTAIINIE